MNRRVWVPAPLLALRDAHRAMGTRRLLAVAPRWLVHPTFVVFVRDARQPSPVPPGGLDLAWEDVDQASLAVVLALNPLLGQAEARRRLAEGQRCYLGRVGGEPVYYRWETTLPAYLPYLGRVFRPLPGDVLVNESYTADRWRGRGVMTAAGDWARRRYAAAGLARHITLAAWWNTPALRVYERAGQVAGGTAGHWRCGPWRRAFTSGAVRTDGAGALFVVPAVPPPGAHPER